MIHIVALTGWYPVKGAPYNGDFIQRHLQCIATTCTVTMIHVTYSHTETNDFIEEKQTGNLTEIIIYLSRKNNVVSKLFSYGRYYRMIHQQLKKIKKEKRIDLIHVHVVKFNGLVALIQKVVARQPYLITEHSTEYIDGKWEAYNFLKRGMIKRVFRNALSVHCVSHYLAGAVAKKMDLKKSPEVIPNVVNTAIFYPDSDVGKEPVFIHISSLTEQKNISDMLAAFGLLKKRAIPFRLKIIGPVSPSLLQAIAENNVQEEVSLPGEMMQSQLANHIRSSNALVLFSSYETFGCVVIEAMACSKPVIVSNLPVFKEIVQENRNGIFCEQNNVHDLAEKLALFAMHQFDFDEQAIAAYAASRFSYEVVARQFLTWYKTCLTK